MIKSVKRYYNHRYNIDTLGKNLYVKYICKNIRMWVFLTLLFIMIYCNIKSHPEHLCTFFLNVTS